MSNRFTVKFIVFDTAKNTCFYRAYGCQPFDEFLEALNDAQQLNKLIDTLEYEKKNGLYEPNYWLRKK